MKMNDATRITLIIVIGAIILGAIGFNSLGNSSYQDTVSVAGTSSLEVMPDLVGIYFSVETTGATSAEANDKNTEIVDALTSALMLEGFEKEEIQTVSFNVYPEYDWNSGTRRLLRYKATHSIRVELSAEDAAKIGSAVSTGIDAGAGVSYINFELSQESQNQYKAEALKLAAEDATIKAEAVVEGLNKKLGELVSVSVDSYDYYPWLARDFAAEGASDSEIVAESADIQPGTQDVSARVTAVFKVR